jgi:hypothetical protein
MKTALVSVNGDESFQEELKPRQGIVYVFGFSHVSLHLGTIVARAGLRCVE